MIETEKVVSCADSFGASASKRFMSDLGQITGERYDLCFASGALQYVAEPRQLMERLLALECPYYLVTRFPLADWLDDDIVTIQNVPATIHEARYPAWFFSPRWLKYFEERGCELIIQADVHADTLTLQGRTFPCRMLLLRKRAPTGSRSPAAPGTPPGSAPS